MSQINQVKGDRQEALSMRPQVSAGGPWTRRELFNGSGAVQLWDLLGRAQAAPFSAALWCELEAGGRVGQHRQQAHPELIICLAGAGLAIVNEQQHKLQPGACVFLPFGALLSLSAAEEGPMSYLIIKAEQATAPAEVQRDDES